jgi:hypothetical protein
MLYRWRVDSKVSGDGGDDANDVPGVTTSVDVPAVDGPPVEHATSAVVRIAIDAVVDILVLLRCSRSDRDPDRMSVSSANLS